LTGVVKSRYLGDPDESRTRSRSLTGPVSAIWTGSRSAAEVPHDPGRRGERELLRH